MKNSPRQPPLPPRVPLEGLLAERQMQRQLHQLFLDDPTLCLQIIRHWLDKPQDSNKGHR